MNERSSLNYVTYLKLEQVLTAQEPRSYKDGRFEPDEMLFIVIHQVYELWFKQTLHELDQLMIWLEQDDVANALATMRRILTILKTLVAQIDILETMTPLQFNSFRAFLEDSSGFQSVQFREVEFALGYKRAAMLNHFPEGLYGRQELVTRFEQPTLWDAFLHFLSRRGYPVPEALLTRDVRQPVEPSAEVRAILLQVYAEAPWVARLCERFVDLDEGLMEWRYRHVKMVARTIGDKMGTGGSAGVGYLSKTVKSIWPDLWAIRTEL